MKNLLTLILLAISASVQSQNTAANTLGAGSQDDSSAAGNWKLLSKLLYQTYAAQLNLKGNVKSLTEVRFNAVNNNGVVITTDTAVHPWTSSFDVNGDLVLSEEHYEDGTEATYQFKYSRPGLATEAKYFQDGNRLEEVMVSEYDNNHYLISYTVYNAKGEIKRRDTYNNLFNPNNRQYRRNTDSSYSVVDDKLVGERSNEFLDITFNEDTAILKKSDSFYGSTITYGYNPLRQKIIENAVDISTGDSLYFTTYEYDSKGNVTKEFAANDYTKNYEYTYDEKGNWTKLILKTDIVGSGVEYHVTERKILYY